MFRFTDLIIFRMTRGCNLDCSYCFMKEKHLHKNEVIDFQLFKKIVHRIIKQRKENNKEKEKLNFVFHGGEILIVGKENLYKMMEYASYELMRNEISYTFSTQTNATLIDDDYAKIFNKFGVQVGISYDGPNEANNPRLITEEDFFLNKFKILEENFVPYGFIVTVNKKNIDKLEETKKFFDTKTKADEYKFNYVEDMIAQGEDSEFEVTGKEFFEKSFLPFLKEALTGEDIREWHMKHLLNNTLVDILSYHDDKGMSYGGCFGKYCGTGLTMIGINPDGGMGRCDRYSKDFEEEYLMHALDYDFLGLKQITEVLRHNIERAEAFRKVGCETCYAKYICEYGCTTLYYSKYKKIGIEKDIVCDQFKMTYDFVLKNIVKYVDTYYKKMGKINSLDKIYYLNPVMENALLKEGYRLSISEGGHGIYIALVDEENDCKIAYNNTDKEMFYEYSS